MHTYEMIATGDENGKTYVSKYGSYNKENGFRLRSCYVNNLSDVEDLFNTLLHEDCWRLKTEKKKMTQEDIEKALGYEIDIVDKNGNPTFDNFQDFWNYVVKEVGK